MDLQNRRKGLQAPSSDVGHGPITIEQAIGQEGDELCASVTKIICALMEKQNISRSELARRMNVSPSHVTQMLCGDRNMTLHTLAEVAYLIGMKCEINFT